MSVLTPMLHMDDNMGLGSPNFFTSAWSPEQNEFSFSETFRSGVDGYTNYTPQKQQGRAENNNLDYFSTQHDSRFTSQLSLNPLHQFADTKSNDDLDQILGTSNNSLFGKTVSAAQPDVNYWPVNESQEMQGVDSYSDSVLFNSTSSLMTDWKPRVDPKSYPAKLVTDFGNGTNRRTSLRNGQITPIDSPPDDTLRGTPKNTRTSPSKNTRDELAITPKLKKPRKSKKKSLTKDQEEAKRTKFLERNRVAADKCRQNRKKWINDLQMKAHQFSADNVAKRVQVEELEQEVVQLRSLLFIHSRSCNKKDIGDWVDQESSRVQNLSKMSRKGSVDDNHSVCSQGSGNTSRPPSSHGFESVSDAMSRHYSTTIVGDDFPTVISGDLSKQNSRRSSIIQ